MPCTNIAQCALVTSVSCSCYHVMCVHARNSYCIANCLNISKSNRASNPPIFKIMDSSLLKTHVVNNVSIAVLTSIFVYQLLVRLIFNFPSLRLCLSSFFACVFEGRCLEEGEAMVFSDENGFSLTNGSSVKGTSDQSAGGN